MTEDVFFSKMVPNDKVHNSSQYVESNLLKSGIREKDFFRKKGYNPKQSTVGI